MLVPYNLTTISAIILYHPVVLPSFLTSYEMVTLTDDKAESDATLSAGGDHTADEDHLPPDYSEATGVPSQATFQDVPLPSFSEPGGSSSSTNNPPFTAAHFVPLTRPTNFLTIVKVHEGARGTFSIDPTLPPPPGAVQSRDRDGRVLNALFSTKHGSTSVVIDIVRSADVKGPARLETNCKHGSTDITIHDRRQNRFRLRVTAKHGSSTIRIPSTFIGSVHSRTDHSQIKFSNEVQQHVTTFSEAGKEGRYFIGDFAAHGYEDDETWHMDHLDIEAEHGTVNIKFIVDRTDSINGDSGNDSNGKGLGFFNRFFST